MIWLSTNKGFPSGEGSLFASRIMQARAAVENIHVFSKVAVVTIKHDNPKDKKS